MRAIIIGAGRGRRLRPYTDDRPKCLVPVAGRPILDWILESFRGVGVTDIVFVGGYRMADIRTRYPELTYVENPDWERNNILASLFHAEPYMVGGFFTAYSDTIIDRRLLEPLLDVPHPITLALDTSWNERHRARPETYDAHVEGTHVEDDRVVRIERIIPPGDALGEFTGVVRLTAEGARSWRDAFADARARHAGRPFHHGKTFETAYLIDLLQEMIDAGAPIGYTTCHGGYAEIDTVADYHLANEHWAKDL